MSGLARDDYIRYIWDNFDVYLDVDLGAIFEHDFDESGNLINSGSITFNLMYLDEHLLKKGEKPLSVDEKIKLVDYYLTHLDSSEQAKFLNNFLQVGSDYSWDDVDWEIVVEESGLGGESIMVRVFV